jgi:hypothetical protein
MHNPAADRVSRQGRDVSRQRGTPSTFNSPQLRSICYAAAMRNPAADRVSRQGRDVSRQCVTPSTFNSSSTPSNFVWSSPNYPTEQLNLKHGRMAYPAKRDSFTKLSSRTTHFKISQDNISCEAGALSTNYPTEQRIVKYRRMACPADRGCLH